MTDSNIGPAFNLWYDPWIELETPAGNLVRVSLEHALLEAHSFVAIYESSPLVVVGIHRLCAAILQAVINPRRPTDLRQLFRLGVFPEEVVRAFGQRYAARFDLFSEDQPFLQSADLPLHPGEAKNIKTIAYLANETPAGTEITHYRHGVEENVILCAACAAKGLVMQPCFATSGGSGIKPSINGVPPIYVLPGGKNLFESLAASLPLPPYQPEAASTKEDAAWWECPPIVPRSAEVSKVGYLHSLTFPARRIRLHPEQMGERCTRCGGRSIWGVRTMVFEMGEFRPKGSVFWFDPFAAYRLPEERSDRSPTPIRPTEGKALWREYAALFMLPATLERKNRTRRPSLLDQLANEGILSERPFYPFRCIGLRTDMKAKVFEWIDASFQVPARMLDDQEATYLVREANQFATDCAAIISEVFRQKFGGSIKGNEHHRGLKERMLRRYWEVLANEFRELALILASPTDRLDGQTRWAEAVVRQAQTAFQIASEAVGEDAVSLQRQVQGQNLCRIRLLEKGKLYLGEGGN